MVAQVCSKYLNHTNSQTDQIASPLTSSGSSILKTRQARAWKFHGNHRYLRKTEKGASLCQQRRNFENDWTQEE